MKPTTHHLPFEIEQDIRRDFTTVQDRVISAAIAACRVSKRTVFYIHPNIAASYGLSPKDLNRTFKRLEGKLFKTVESRKGKYRRIRFIDFYVGKE